MERPESPEAQVSSVERRKDSLGTQKWSLGAPRRGNQGGLENGEIAQAGPELNAEPWLGLKWQPPVVGIQNGLWTLGWGFGGTEQVLTNLRSYLSWRGLLRLRSPHNGISELACHPRSPRPVAKAYPTEGPQRPGLATAVCVHLGVAQAPCPCIMQYLPGG